VLMTWQAIHTKLYRNHRHGAIRQGLTDITRHVIRCNITQETGFKTRVERVAGNGPGRCCDKS